MWIKCVRIRCTTSSAQIHTHAHIHWYKYAKKSEKCLWNHSKRKVTHKSKAPNGKNCVRKSSLHSIWAKMIWIKFYPRRAPWIIWNWQLIRAKRLWFIRAIVGQCFLNSVRAETNWNVWYCRPFMHCGLCRIWCPHSQHMQPFCHVWLVEQTSCFLVWLIDFWMQQHLPFLFSQHLIISNPFICVRRHQARHGLFNIR